MVDAGVIWGNDVQAAYDRAIGFAPMNITWLEEPFRTYEVDAYKQLKDRHPPVKIAAGEGANNYRQAEDMIVNGKLDFLQIDVGRVGGITVADRLCRKALQSGIQYVNHSFKSHLQVAASLHIFAGVPQFKYLEYPAGDSPLVLGLTSPTGLFPDSDGMINVSNSPGLGVTINKDTLRKYLRRVKIEIDGKPFFESVDI